jgi:hypothetical protein
MSRSPTRTPPLRISPAFLSAVAALDDGAAAAVMRIAAHHAESGRPMTVGEFGARTGQDGLFLHAVLQGLSHLLDQSALGAGQLVVAEIAQGLAHRAGIMSKRSEAANLRYVRAAARQKAEGGEIKLTRGRVATVGKGAAAAGSSDASDPPACTRVHKEADYAHLHAGVACTHVHNPGADAHACIQDDDASVHKERPDAHLCIDDFRDSEEHYAHMCIPLPEDDREPAENLEFSPLDRSGLSSHVRGRPPRADLPISNHPSSKKNERVESARAHGEAPQPMHDASRRRSAHRTGREAQALHTAVATSNHDHGGKLLRHEERVMATLPGYRPSAGSSAAEVPAEFVRRLLEAGPVDGDTARAKLAGWIARWGEPFVRSGIEAIPNKRLGRPLSYLDSILTNLAKEEGTPPPRTSAERTGLPTQDTVEPSAAPLPRRVRRRVSVPPGAAWECLGWTASGREGDAGSRRRKVWRTESGDLRYMDATASEHVPTYEEDPGVYAYD